MAASTEQDRPVPSGLLAELLEAEAANERSLAGARAEAARIVEEAREAQRRADESLVRELEEMRRGVRERLDAARRAELAVLASGSRDLVAAYGRLAAEGAGALAAEVVQELLEGGAP